MAVCAIIGQTITYAITLINEGDFNETDLSLVDEMPEGFVYTRAPRGSGA